MIVTAVPHIRTAVFIFTLDLKSPIPQPKTSIQYPLLRNFLIYLGKNFNGHHLFTQKLY